MLHSLGGHALTDGIAFVERVGFDVAEFFIPGGGPVAAGVAGEPLAERGFNEVDPQGLRHQSSIKPPMVSAVLVGFGNTKNRPGEGGGCGV